MRKWTKLTTATRSAGRRALHRHQMGRSGAGKLMNRLALSRGGGDAPAVFSRYSLRLGGAATPGASTWRIRRKDGMNPLGPGRLRSGPPPLDARDSLVGLQSYR